VAAIIGLAYLFLRWRKYPRMSDAGYFIDGITITFLFPFILPLMHDRYFFIAALLLFVLAFLDKHFIWPAVLIQISSMISYFQSWHILMPLAVAINTILAVWLVTLFIHNLKTENQVSPIKEDA
jgi:hypothetical protein